MSQTVQRFEFFTCRRCCLGKKLTNQSWVALVLLFFGLVIVQLSEGSHGSGARNGVEKNFTAGCIGRYYLPYDDTALPQSRACQITQPSALYLSLRTSLPVLLTNCVYFISFSLLSARHYTTTTCHSLIRFITRTQTQ